ncbi:MAG: RNA methyltransferase [Prevotella sp.]|nr:RNA methyltransferase [Prevotella sp.]
MQNQFKMIAKTFMGLETVLAEELTKLGADNVQVGRRMVSFTGDKEMMYRANFQLHTAIRILKPIAEFRATSAEDMYDEVRKIDWSQYIQKGKTFSVDSVVYSEEFRNSRFVTYKVKDAIADQFREQTGERPNVSVSSPDLRIHIHIADFDATLCLDSSGESLHRRGYRQEQTEAPLNEVLAAGLIMLTGWHGECDFIDPMCGSGTLLIEAALIAHNMSPGLFRKEFAFEKWPDFDQELFDKIYNDDSQESTFEHHIYGYDNNPKAISKAIRNVRAAGLTKDISIELRDFKDFTKPAEKALIVTNPPYGERISTANLLETYKMIGERLKHEFTGNDAWILSYREECFEQIGLKPSIKIPVFNGSLECEFRRYSLFEGKMKVFREEGGIVKTEADKAAMAERRRFKAHREFKKRLDEQEENEHSDIRSFTFHSLERRHEEEARREAIAKKMARRERRENDFKHGEGNFNRDEKGFGRGEKGFGRGEKGFGRGEKKFGRDGFKRNGDGFRRDRDGGFKRNDGGFKRGESSFRKGGNFKRNDGYKRGGQRG